MGKISGLGLMQSDAAIPKLSGDIRPLIPTIGLRNYWYPAIVEGKVGGRKPVKVALLGEEICLFRGGNGHVAAIQDVCPHRGARLSAGQCHYRGTVACPYHGWVFDESGKNVAVLSEGPDSGVCGRPGTEAHIYPTRVLINWLLTKDAQIHWAKEVEQNSRRAGVEPGNPQLLPPKGAKLFQVDAEESLPEVIKTQDIAKAVIK